MGPPTAALEMAVTPNGTVGSMYTNVQSNIPSGIMSVQQKSLGKTIPPHETVSVLTAEATVGSSSAFVLAAHSAVATTALQVDNCSNGGVRGTSPNPEDSTQTAAHEQPLTELTPSTPSIVAKAIINGNHKTPVPNDVHTDQEAFELHSPALEGEYQPEQRQVYYWPLEIKANGMDPAVQMFNTIK